MSLREMSVPEIWRATLLCFILASLAASVLSVRPVLACSPTATLPGFKGFTVADHTNASDVIVEGTVTAVRTYDPTQSLPFVWGSEEATIEVRQYVKGNGPTIVRMRGFGE